MNNKLVASVVVAALLVQPALARVNNYGNQSRVNVENRSANVNHNTNVNRNANVNRNVNVNNNTNVNRNVNVNVDRNVNVHGAVVYDNDYNWGAFAAGAAVGVATTAAVAAATRPPAPVVVAAPAIGTVVQALPASCATVTAGGAAIYNCNNVFYRPYYQGTTLVYQVVTYP
jgi:hypothetical protein